MEGIKQTQLEYVLYRPVFAQNEEQYRVTHTYADSELVEYCVISNWNISWMIL